MGKCALSVSTVTSSPMKPCPVTVRLDDHTLHHSHEEDEYRVRGSGWVRGRSFLLSYQRNAQIKEALLL